MRISKGTLAVYERVGEEMITKDEFIETLKKGGVDVDEVEPELADFDVAVDAALKIRAAMPGIGFGSVSGRMNCFVAVCRHLDTMIENSEIDLSGSQIVLNILRLKDKKFRKAITMFDLRGSRYRAAERAELPRSAVEYLAGLEMCR